MSATMACAKSVAPCLVSYAAGRDVPQLPQYTAPQMQSWFAQLAFCSVALQNGAKPAHCTVGTLRESARTVPPRTIIEGLFATQTIETFLHLNSTMCLARESTDHGVYHATFTGSHTYCTNDCHTDPINFTLRIGTDGVVSVAP